MPLNRSYPGFHFYERSPYSGAGNCVCGAAQESPHHPHTFRQAYADRERCVCGAGLRDAVHTRDRGN